MFTKHINKILLFLLSLNPIIWFLGKGTSFLNGVDINYPLDPLKWFVRRFFVWNSIGNAGSDFSSSTSGLFFHLIQVIPYVLGANLQITQVISLVFWFTLIIFSSYLFATIIIPKKFFFQFIFVVLYSYNIYLFNTWENIKVANLALVSATPLILYLFTKVRRKEIEKFKAAFFLFLSGILLSGSGINPSYFIAFFLIIFIYALGEALTKQNIKEVLDVIKDFLFVAICIIGANLFWIFPALIYIFKNVSSTSSISSIGFTNWLGSLSENTSLLNVMRLQGAWDWYAFDSVTGLPLYIPYALNFFYKIPFIFFSFLLTGLAIYSIFYKNKIQNGLYISFLIMFALGVFLGSGSHEPTGFLYTALSAHLPFFSLFRSPWYIFTPMITISIAGLVSLLFYNLYTLFVLRSNKTWVVGLFAGAIIFLIGNFLYTYPLVTGKVFRYTRHDSFFVHFPGYVFDAQKWLSSRDIEGRIISYPDDEIENFDWGYRGIESVLSLISDSEVLYSPLNESSSQLSLLIKEYYMGLKKGQAEVVHNLASKLNVGYIFDKRDQRSISPDLPEFITAGTKTNFGEWNFYEFPKTDRIYTSNKIYRGSPYGDGAKYIAVLKNDESLVDVTDSVVSDQPNLLGSAGRLIYSMSSQIKDLSEFTSSSSVLNSRLKTRDPMKVEYEFVVEEAGLYSPHLERYRIEDFGLNPLGNLDLTIDGQRTTWVFDSVTDTYIKYKPVNLESGSHKALVSLNNPDLIQSGNFEAHEAFVKNGNGAFNIEAENGSNVLGILNVGEGNSEPSADFKLEKFDYLGKYLVQLKYRQIYGNNGSVVVFQNNLNTVFKAQTERLPNHPNWNTFSFFYEPVIVKSDLKISLVAPFTSDPLGTKVLYDDLSVYKIFSNSLLIMKDSNSGFLSTPQVSYKKINPVTYSGSVDKGNSPHLVVFSENYSPDWEFSVYDITGRKINVNTSHLSVNTYANSWYVDNAPDKYNFKIYYKHQNLFWLGTIVTASSFAIILFAWFKFNRKKNV